MARLRSFWWRAYHRSFNRWADTRAWWEGACNLSTWDEESARYWGGYAHWRCAKAAKHEGPHRFQNYVWDGPGVRPVFRPLPLPDRLLSRAEVRAATEAELPFQDVTAKRYMISSLRRTRLMRRFADKPPPAWLSGRL